MNEQEVQDLLSAVSAVTGQSVEEITNLIKGGKKTEFQTSMGSLLSRQFNDGETKGLREGAAKIRGQLDAALKKEGITVNFGEFGDDFMAEIKAKFGEILKVVPNESQAIKDLKAQIETYKTEVADAKNKLTEVETKAKADFDVKLAKLGRKQEVVADLKAQLADLNAIIPDDKDIAEKRLTAMLKDIDNYDDFEKDVATGDWKMKDADGNIIRNQQTQMPVLFKANYAKDLISVYYNFASTSEKDGDSADPNKDKSGGSGAYTFKEFKGTPPTNKAEYLKLLTDETLGVTVHAEVKDYYNKVVVPQQQTNT